MSEPMQTTQTTENKMGVLPIGKLLVNVSLPIVGIFNASDNMLTIGIPALRIISLSFPFAGYCISTSSAMQALGSAFYSMVNSLTRQLIVLLPSAFPLAAVFRARRGLPAIWFSFLIAEGVSVLMITAFYRRVYRQKVAPLPD